MYNKEKDNSDNKKRGKKSEAYGRNKNKGLIADREEMEKGIERILRDIDS